LASKLDETQMISNAGPEMDSKVARLLFSTVVIIDTQSGVSYMMGKDREPIPVPPFSTDMETAYEITDLMQDYGHELHMKKARNGDDKCWYACFSKEDGRQYVSSSAATAAEAICVAALAALKGDNIYKGVKVI
jgi:hypothetical protein